MLSSKTPVVILWDIDTVPFPENMSTQKIYEGLNGIVRDPILYWYILSSKNSSVVEENWKSFKLNVIFPKLSFDPVKLKPLLEKLQSFTKVFQLYILSGNNVAAQFFQNFSSEKIFWTYPSTMPILPSYFRTFHMVPQSVLYNEMNGSLSKCYMTVSHSPDSKRTVERVVATESRGVSAIQPTESRGVSTVRPLMMEMTTQSEAETTLPADPKAMSLVRKPQLLDMSIQNAIINEFIKAYVEKGVRVLSLSYFTSHQSEILTESSISKILEKAVESDLVEMVQTEGLLQTERYYRLRDSGIYKALSPKMIKYESLYSIFKDKSVMTIKYKDLFKHLDGHFKPHFSSFVDCMKQAEADSVIIIGCYLIDQWALTENMPIVEISQKVEEPVNELKNSPGALSLKTTDVDIVASKSEASPVETETVKKVETQFDLSRNTKDAAHFTDNDYRRYSDFRKDTVKIDKDLEYRKLNDSRDSSFKRDYNYVKDDIRKFEPVRREPYYRSEGRRDSYEYKKETRSDSFVHREKYSEGYKKIESRPSSPFKKEEDVKVTEKIITTEITELKEPFDKPSDKVFETFDRPTSKGSLSSTPEVQLVKTPIQEKVQLREEELFTRKKLKLEGIGHEIEAVEATATPMIAETGGVVLNTERIKAILIDLFEKNTPRYSKYWFDIPFEKMSIELMEYQYEIVCQYGFISLEHFMNFCEANHWIEQNNHTKSVRLLLLA